MYFELCILDTVYEEVYWTENVNRLIGPKNVQKYILKKKVKILDLLKESGMD